MAYSPATNLTTSAGLPHVQVTYYKKKALDRLQKKFLFRNACMADMIPKQEGRTVQWFRYFNLSANTTPTSEGAAAGTGLSPTSRVVSATVSQYTAFLTISDFLTDSAIDPLVENHAELLGYQAGLSVDTITRNVIDAESTSTAQTLLGSFLRVADIRNSRHALQAIDVQPHEDGQFYCILHPYVSYDLVNDPAAGGLADIVKYTDPKSTPLVKYEDRGLITSVAGTRVVESTNVFTQASPNRYRVYVFGKDGIGCVEMAGRGPSKTTDPKKQRFSVKVGRPDVSVADPEGVIGAFVSYNFIYTAAVLDGPAGIGGVYRYKTLDPSSSIS